MHKIIFHCFLLISCFQLSAQEINSLYKTKKIAISKDTIEIEKVSINPSFFKLETKNGKPIDSTFYKIDFPSGKLIFNKNAPISDTLVVQYLQYPDFLTKVYSIYDDERVVPNEDGNLYKVNREVKKFIPFDGLNTSGSITRGVTVGNNQNTTVSSNLDLQITEKYPIKSRFVLLFKTAISRCKVVAILKN